MVQAAMIKLIRNRLKFLFTDGGGFGFVNDDGHGGAMVSGGGAYMARLPIARDTDIFGIAEGWWRPRGP